MVYGKILYEGKIFNAHKLWTDNAGFTKLGISNDVMLII